MSGRENKSILTPRMWIALILLSATMSFIGVLTAPFAPSWAWSMILTNFSAPIVVLFILLIISKATGWSAFSPQKLGLLHTVMAMSICFCGTTWVPYGIVHNAATCRLVSNEPYTSSIAASWVFGPSDPGVVKLIQTGGVAAPFGDWSPFIGWWTVYTISWLVFWVGWFSLLEERWIREEKLPFPAAMTGTMQIELITTSEEKGSDPRLKCFLIGFILGVITLLPIVLHLLMPSFPDIYGWTTSPFISWWLGTINLAGVPWTKAIPVWCFLPTNPLIYALFFLFPRKILFSTWFFSIVGVLIPAQIAWYMGYYSDSHLAIEESGWRYGFLSAQEPFKYEGIWFGVSVGLIVAWFLLNPSYLKSLFKGSSNPHNRAISHKLGWGMIAVATIVLVGMLIAAGVNLIGSILIVFSMWIMFSAVLRIYGFASITAYGPAYSIDWNHLPVFTKYIYYPGITTSMLRADSALATEYTTTMLLTNRFTGGLLGFSKGAIGMIYSIPMCYKVGYDTGTHPRDITKLILISGAISAIIGYPTALWLGYHVGTDNTPMQLFDAWWIWTFSSVPQLSTGMPAPEPIWPYITVGIALSVILSFLNFRFIWWPLDPVGVALALGAGGTGWILPALISWTVKTIIVKKGSTRLESHITKPIAVGLIVGYWFTMFLGALIGLIQFLITHQIPSWFF